MDTNLFQNVFELLENYLPDSWSKVVFYAAYTSRSYSMKFYTKSGDSQFVDCFSQRGSNQMQLLKLFMSIDKILSVERKSLSEDKRWNVFTMTVDSSGRMNTDFDYTNIEENAIKYEREWKCKYL